MPNRIIKESICRSDSIDSLSWFEEVLFYRLIVVCDDYGRFDGRPAIIRGSCFPLKDMRLKDIENALDKLSAAGMVRQYESGGRPYLQLISWEQHQQIRAKKSKFPPYDETCNQLISDDSNSPRNPIQSETNPNRNIKSMCKADALALFERLWKMYPVKKGKGQVSEDKKMKLLAIGFEEMSRAVGRYLEELEKDGWRQPQNGSTFFNSGYIDYLDANYVPDKRKRQEKPSQYNQFMQNDYDFEQLEREIVSN